jgi:hypothetical protein
MLEKSEASSKGKSWADAQLEHVLFGTPIDETQNKIKNTNTIAVNQQDSEIISSEPILKISHGKESEKEKEKLNDERRSKFINITRKNKKSNLNNSHKLVDSFNPKKMNGKYIKNLDDRITEEHLDWFSILNPGTSPLLPNHTIQENSKSSIKNLTRKQLLQQKIVAKNKKTSKKKATTKKRNNPQNLKNSSMKQKTNRNSNQKQNSAIPNPFLKAINQNSTSIKKDQAKRKNLDIFNPTLSKIQNFDDGNKWLKLGDKCYEEEDYVRAEYCYKKSEEIFIQFQKKY